MGPGLTLIERQDFQIEPTILSPSGIDLQLLDQDALRAVQRLQSRGFEAYLVGGSVRDLLLGRSPKDYDIATEARPQQVKRTFPRNSRIIGRRFKLAHLHFDNNTKILEVSTFRRTPQLEGEDSDDLLIVRDNEFGNAEEDALRRDFTVNALFLDPVEDRIIDYTGGLEDLYNRTMRTIGEPVVRFREDPVRILRAAKFSGRLTFLVDPGTLEAMAEVAPDLTRAAPPRVLEEIQRLLRGGHALESFQLLRDIGALKVMLPVVAEFLGEADQAHREVFWRLLEALDHQVQDGREFPNPVLLGTLFSLPINALSERNGSVSVGTIAEEILGPFSSALRLPRRDAGCLKRICGVQHRFINKGKRRFKIASFLRDPYFPDALQLFELTCMARGSGFQEFHRWRDLVIEEFGMAGKPAEEPVKPESPQAKGGHKRRRGRGSDDGEAKAPEQRTETVDAGAEAAPRGRTRRRAGSAGPGRKRGKRDAGANDEPRQDTGRKKKAAKKTGSRAAPTGKKAAKAPRKRGTKKTSRGADRVETIEPEPPDISTFAVELDPRRVPSFGSIVEGQPSRRRRPRKDPADDEGDDYKPPPPPVPDGDAPPPSDDTFGDW